MQENFEYRGFSIRLFTRGLTRRRDEGLHTVDIWISNGTANAQSSNWTIFSDANLAPSLDPDRLRHDAFKAVQLHIDELL